MSLARPFWEAYRGRLSKAFADYGRRKRSRRWSDSEGNCRWTQSLVQAAKDACADLQPLLGCELDICGECIQKLDVHAQDDSDGRLIIAFESELGRFEHPRGWHLEFRKLCGIEAQLRVLLATFPRGEGKRYPGALSENLGTMRQEFTTGKRGDFLVIFGPESNLKDADQPWLVYTLTDDMTPIPLPSDDPFLACKYLGR